MSIKELAEYLGIGKSKIYNLIRMGKIPASKIGRQYRFSKTVVDEWLKEKIVSPRRPPQMGLFEIETASSHKIETASSHKEEGEV